MLSISTVVPYHRHRPGWFRSKLLPSNHPIVCTLFMMFECMISLIQLQWTAKQYNVDLFTTNVSTHRNVGHRLKMNMYGLMPLTLNGTITRRWHTPISAYMKMLCTGRHVCMDKSNARLLVVHQKQNNIGRAFCSRLCSQTRCRGSFWLLKWVSEQGVFVRLLKGTDLTSMIGDWDTPALKHASQKLLHRSFTPIDCLRLSVPKVVQTLCLFIELRK